MFEGRSEVLTIIHLGYAASFLRKYVLCKLGFSITVQLWKVCRAFYNFFKVQLRMKISLQLF